MNHELHLAADEATHRRLTALVLRNSPEEEVCFALLAPSTGQRRRTLVIRDIIEPEPHERTVRGNVSFSAALVDRAIDAAIDARAGLALVHSHPFGRGFQSPSSHDLRAERRTLETAAFALGGRPVASIIVAGDGTLSGREYRFPRPGGPPLVTANAVTRIVGPHLEMQFGDGCDGKERSTVAHASHVGMFGARAQDLLRRLKVGIVGLGSVGGLVNIQLARLGVGHCGGFDFDVVEERNLNRLPAFSEDARRRRLKVEVAEREARRAATAASFEFSGHFASIVEEAGVRSALDYDVLFSCADSHWSRQVLNALSFANLIPVIDGGTGIHSDDHDAFLAASFRTQVVGPGRGCLACGGGFDPAAIGEEMAGMVLPHYAGRAAKAVGAPSVGPLNMMLAGSQILRFMEVVLKISGLRELGQQRFDYAGGDIQVEVIHCRPDCAWSAQLGLGAQARIPTGIDPRFTEAKERESARLASVDSQVRSTRGRRVRPRA